MNLSASVSLQTNENTEDCGTALPGQVETNYWPVLSKMHARQSGKYTVKNLRTKEEKKESAFHLS